jgi:predicted Zn finger-like uncharacterized protein
MILTCPACSTRFTVDAAALGTTGKRVRCGSCKHVWHQAPPAVEVEDEAPPPMPKAVAAEPAASTPRVDAEGAPLHPPISSARTPRQPRRTGSAGLAWSLLALVVILVVGGSVVGKDAIMEAWPESERLYAAFGMTNPAAGDGLELRKVSWKREGEGDTPVLAIDGEVANISKGVRSVPKIRAALVSKDGKELQSWVFAPPKVNLIPGESVPFHTEVKNPPDGADQLTMVFSRES